MRLINLTDRRFGNLLVIRRLKKVTVRGEAIWLCQCNCGSKCEATSPALRNGIKASCGCSAAARAAHARSFIVRRTEQDFIDQFWSRVEINIADKCWPWLGGCDSNGYGILSAYNGKLTRAHRIAWSLSRKCKPGKWMVRHRCDNPPCCNPVHLFRGTQKQNIQEARTRSRMVYRKGPKPSVGGANNGHAKLTDDKVLWARRQFSSGKATLTALSKTLGVTPGALSPAVNGKTWKHLQ